MAIQNLRPAMPHQIAALEKFKNSKILPLFLEMRLGKSLIAIRWANQHSGRKLIIAPLSTLNDWERELQLEGISEIIWLNRREKYHRLNAPGNYWYLVNYERLRNHEEFSDINWKTVIADESTRIRNPKAQITKILQKQYQVEYKAILSGFPAPEDPINFFEQFKFLQGQFLGFDNFWAFRHRFFHQDWSGFNWTPNLGTATMIKQEVHKLGFILTRKEAGIGSKKIYERRFVELNPKQRTQYKKVEKDFAYLAGKEEIQTKWAPVKFLWMSRIAGGFLPDSKTLISDAKINELLSIIKEDLKGEKVVVWFRFNSELQIVAKRLKENKISYHSITGKTLVGYRGAKTIEFRKSKKIKVMLCQVKCGKYGIDWSIADTAIYYSNSYDAEDRFQSEDRIVHPKKKEPVLYIDLITKDTIDEEIVDILQDKKISAEYFMKELQARLLKRIKG